MPTIHYRGREIGCEDGAVLRDALTDAGVTPHNGRADRLNCRGMSTCGTCAVEVDGDVSELNDRERRRLSFPPHDLDDGLRLACQTRVHGDVTVTKHDGFWGQHVDDTVATADATAHDDATTRDDAIGADDATAQDDEA